MRAIVATVPAWMVAALAPAMAQQGPIQLLPAPVAASAAGAPSGAAIPLSPPALSAQASGAQASIAPASTTPAPIVLAPVVAAAAPAADTGFLRTTTETLEYCKHLSGRVDNLLRDAKSGSSEQVRSLSQEGERLCQHGQTRNGIYHLRRAFVILSKPEPAR